jgi:hypothetical protein
MDELKLKEQPTIMEPEEGTFYTVVNGRQIMVAEAEYWVEPDQAVTVRSREFDCFATGATFEEALKNFGRAVFDYAEALEQRVDDGSATPTEKETLKLLSGRLSRIYLEERRIALSRKRRSLLRRRGRHDDHDLTSVLA